MGAISIDPVKNRAAVNTDECVECYTCFRGMSMEKLNPTLVRGIRRVLKAFRLRFDPEPDVCPTSAIIGSGTSVGICTGAVHNVPSKME